MSKKLLSLLIEEIKEQGYGLYWGDIKLDDDTKLKDTRGYDFEKNKSISLSDKKAPDPVASSNDNNSGETNVLTNYTATDYKGKDYGFTLNNYPECVDKGKPCVGGKNGDWNGTLPRSLEVASWLKEMGINPGSQKRSKKETANNNVSDHWSGQDFTYAIDFPCKGKKGDKAYLKLKSEFESRGMVTNGVMSVEQTKKNKGKWINFNHNGYRYQIGWNVKDHYDHIHLGVKKL
jgi:hypothetical protein